MTAEQTFEYYKIPHDYALFARSDTNWFSVAILASTEAELDGIVENIYKQRREIYKTMGKEFPHYLKTVRLNDPLNHENYYTF